MPDIRHRGVRQRISDSHVETWVPRGFAVVHSEAPGTGSSQGCPTVGGDVEALAPKAGKRIGLMIFSSDREFTLRPDPGTELTVDLDGTSLTLPVVGGEASLRTALR